MADKDFSPFAPNEGSRDPVMLPPHPRIVPEEISWETNEPSDLEPSEIFSEPLEESEEPTSEEEAYESDEDNQNADESPEEAPSSPEADDQQRPPEKVKRKRNNGNKRISELTRQHKQSLTMLQDVLARNQFLEQKLQEQKKEHLISEENLLKSQKERVKKILADAIEEGDAAKITEAQDLLSEYNAQLQWKKNQLSNPEPMQPVTPAAYPSHPQPEVQFDDAAWQWLEANPWADEHSAEHFDPYLREEANQYSIKLEKKYRLQGRSSEIGSQEFFDDITRFMRSSYGIQEDNEDIGHHPASPTPQTKGRMQMKTPSAPPVLQGTNTRTSSPTRQPSNAPITLTPEQRQIARSMKGHIKDPRTGIPIQDIPTLEKIYAQSLRSMN